MHSVSEIFDCWPTDAELASDLGEKPNTVRKWKYRNSIPKSQWQPLLTSANRRGYPVTAEQLVKIAAERQG